MMRRAGLDTGSKVVNCGHALSGDWPTSRFCVGASFRAAASMVIVALCAGGCAVKPAPITNPALGPVGVVAVRAAQIVNTIDIGQRQIEPLVDAGVLTAAEGLTVARALGVALEQAKALVAVLTLADTAGTLLEARGRVQEAIKALLRTVQGAMVGVSGFGGRIVVGAITGSVTDAVGELVPVVGAR